MTTAIQNAIDSIAKTQENTCRSPVFSQPSQTTAPALRFITCGSVDDGKSTLIGRLLLDSKAVLQDHLAGVQRAGQTDLALLTDGLVAEREQGITIDVAWRYFATQARKFIIGDTPGHEQYTRNMVTAASNADAAVLLVDATKLAWQQDAFELLVQTRRHALLCHLLRVPSLVFAINKLDAVAEPAQAFERIRAALQGFAQQAGMAPRAVVPISALKSYNVVHPHPGWCGYHGPSLLHLLETLPASTDHAAADAVGDDGSASAAVPATATATATATVASAANSQAQAIAAQQTVDRPVKQAPTEAVHPHTHAAPVEPATPVAPETGAPAAPAQPPAPESAATTPQATAPQATEPLATEPQALAFPVQWVEKHAGRADTHQGRRIFWGRVAQGALRPGQTVQVLPGGKTAQITQVLSATRQPAAAPIAAGQSAGLVLDREIDVSRGDWLWSGLPGAPRRDITATVAWMDDEPLIAGRVYWALHGHRWVKARVQAIAHGLNIHTLAQEPAHNLGPNAIGQVQLALQEPLAVQPYAQSRTLGAMILVDTASHRTAGAVLVQ